MCVCVGMRGCLYVCSGSPCKGGLIGWAAIPLKPLPFALDPFPDPLLNNQHKQKSVKHKGATDSTAFRNFFSFLGNTFLPVKRCCLMAGCLGRQACLHCPTRGGAEDARAPKGSERAGWDVKIKTCKFFSTLPAWAVHMDQPFLASASTHF